MLRLAFGYEDADGPHEVVVGPATLVAWERKTGRKISQFADGIGAEATEITFTLPGERGTLEVETTTNPS